MKATLKTGISTRRSFTVDRDSTIGFMGEDARVYATPMLVRDIEITCRDFLLEHLDAGEDSVGIRVEIDHLAATLLGMRVEIAVTLGELKGRAAIFDVVATDGIDTICRGRHARFIANVAQVKARLAEKQKKAA
jgi:fluoroacetyl-CoA thioesterase